MASEASGVTTGQPNLHKQDLSKLNVSKLTALSPEVISRQATINIGTIGHVAHGKSTVVKAISGVQTVRFKNELERNITIKLERLKFDVNGKVIVPQELTAHGIISNARIVDLVDKKTPKHHEQDTRQRKHGGKRKRSETSSVSKRICTETYSDMHSKWIVESIPHTGFYGSSENKEIRSNEKCKNAPHQHAKRRGRPRKVESRENLHNSIHDAIRLRFVRKNENVRVEHERRSSKTLPLTECDSNKNVYFDRSMQNILTFKDTNVDDYQKVCNHDIVSNTKISANKRNRRKLSTIKKIGNKLNSEADYSLSSSDNDKDGQPWYQQIIDYFGIDWKSRAGINTKEEWNKLLDGSKERGKKRNFVTTTSGSFSKNLEELVQRKTTKEIGDEQSLVDFGDKGKAFDTETTAEIAPRPRRSCTMRNPVDWNVEAGGIKLKPKSIEMETPRITSSHTQQKRRSNKFCLPKENDDTGRHRLSELDDSFDESGDIIKTKGILNVMNKLKLILGENENNSDSGVSSAGSAEIYSSHCDKDVLIKTEPVQLPSEKETKVVSMGKAIEHDKHKLGNAMFQIDEKYRFNQQFNGYELLILKEDTTVEESDEVTTHYTNPTKNYEVEEIVGLRLMISREEYMVKWVGYPSSANTWEPFEHLQNSLQALSDFMQVLMDVIVWKAMFGKYLRNFPLSNSTLCQFLPPGGINKLGTKLDTQRQLLIYYAKQPKEFYTKIIEKVRATCIEYVMILKHEKQKKRMLKWQKKINKSEKLPLGVENVVDFEVPPTNFNYINEYVMSSNIVLVESVPNGCECDECPGSRRCCGNRDNDRYVYTMNKRVRVPQGFPIYECNKSCKCGPECRNRVVQQGSKTPLAIFRTSNGCGWGVKALDSINKGEYVCQYVGEVITHDEAERRGKHYDSVGLTYLFDLDFDSPDNLYTVDAAKYGNVSHFINHSCDPNIGVWAVWIDCQDRNLPQLALFALRHIKKNEELTFDYMCDNGGGSKRNTPLASPVANNSSPPEEPSEGKMLCRCNSDNCRRYLF